MRSSGTPCYANARLLMSMLTLSMFAHSGLAQDPGDRDGTIQAKSFSVGASVQDSPRLKSTSLVTVLPGNNSSSGNGRAPQGPRLFVNSKYLTTGDEMTAAGFPATPVTSIGWEWNLPMPPAGLAPLDQTIQTIGTLRVFLKDTAATASGLIGTFIDTNGVGYTKIIDGTITLPSGVAQIDTDVFAGGPGTAPFTPTPGNGVLVIFVYKTTTPLGTPLGAPTVHCTNVGSILTYQSQTINGTTGTASTFRPLTRFGLAGVPPVDVVKIPAIYALGKIPIPAGNPDIIGVPITNVTTTTPAAFDVTVTVKNALSGTVIYSSTQNVPSLAPGATQIVSFGGWSPTISEDDSIIATTSAISGETLTSNNTLAMLQTVNANTFSYGQDTTASGGVGFTGATGDFVAKFTTHLATTIDQIQVNFAAAGQPYNLGIWDTTGVGGTPGTNVFISGPLTSTIGAVAVPISPAVTVNGSFYVGVRQTGTTNLLFSYQTEYPIRPATFYFTTPTGGTTWTDFAPANPFRLMIGARISGPTSVPESAPREFALSQNYPNPFNPSTEIKFSVENRAQAALVVYDLLGQTVATLFNQVAEPGQQYRLQFNAANFAGGVYFYGLQSGTKSELRKMVFIK